LKLEAVQTLDLLFTVDCIIYVLENLVVDEPVDAIAPREAFEVAALVLHDPAEDVVRDTRVDSPRKAGHDVNEEALFAHSNPSSIEGRTDASLRSS
jgi:hypothetical protein